MQVRKLQANFFLAVLLIGLIFTLAVFRSYLVLLAFAGVLSILSRPIYHRFLSLVKSSALAALLTTITVAAIILVPVSLFFTVLYHELVVVVIASGNGVASLDVARLLQTYLPEPVKDQVPVIMGELMRSLQQIGTAVSNKLFGLFSNAVSLVVGFLITLIAVYYLQKDGTKIKAKLMHLSPLHDKYDELVLQRVVVAVRAVMGGELVIAIIKAFIAGTAFWIFGIPAPLFWGGMTGFSSMIPILGTGLVTVPAVAYLVLIGRFGAAFGLALTALLIVGTIDNFLQPVLVQRKTEIHPLLVLLSILGGLQFYGFAGFILGPLTLTVTMTLLDIYEREFREYLQGET